MKSMTSRSRLVSETLGKIKNLERRLEANLRNQISDNLDQDSWRNQQVK